MAANDGFIGAVLMPLSMMEILHNGKWLVQRHWCLLVISLNMIFCTVSIYHVLSLALDRYLAVCRPLLYRILSIRVRVAVICCCWLVPILSYTIAISVDVFSTVRQPSGQCHICYTSFSVRFYTVAVVVAFYIPFIVILILYIIIFHKIRQVTNYQERKRLNIKKQISFHFSLSKCLHRTSCEANSKISETGRKISCVEVTCRTHNEAKHLPTDPPKEPPTQVRLMSGSPRKSSKACRTIGMVIVCFTLCWLPFIIYLPVKGNQNLDIPLWVSIVTCWLAYLNSTINPFLFYTNRSVQDAIKLLLCAKN
ncbi:D(2) dopamine receptor-like [Physella acuta]|uniref:D(2) dopamine receptor-like n=1 Tax=Physella acuta TaxID=109671 RepID=UPI0027DC0AA6|nr:D(2) dopamine receptor-like [Physella acuta]